MPIGKWRWNAQIFHVTDATGDVSRRQSVSHIPEEWGRSLPTNAELYWTSCGGSERLLRLISQAEIWVFIWRVVAPLTRWGNEVTAPNLRISVGAGLLRRSLRLWCPGFEEEEEEEAWRKINRLRKAPAIARVLGTFPVIRLGVRPGPVRCNWLPLWLVWIRLPVRLGESFKNSFRHIPVIIGLLVLSSCKHVFAAQKSYSERTICCLYLKWSIVFITTKSKRKCLRNHSTARVDDASGAAAAAAAALGTWPRAPLLA